MKRRIISLILCVLMIVPCFLFGVSAEGETTTEEPFQDISAESMLKASSQWNYYSAPKYTIDGKLDNITVAVGGYEFWRPNAPGRDSAVNMRDTWIEYRYKEYKELDTITMYAQKHSTNTKYRLQVLIMGEWYEFEALSNNKAEIYTYTAKVNGKEQTFSGDTIKLVWDTDEIVKAYNLDNPDNPLPEGNLNTKRFRVYFDYSDQWNPPIIYETVIMGRQGQVPEFDVPDDAELSTNAALSGHVYASSSVFSRYPALAVDKTYTTSWKSSKSDDGEWIKAEFDSAYDISNLAIDIGGIVAEDASSFDIEVQIKREDGTWEALTTKTGVQTTTSYENNNKVLLFEGDDDNLLEKIKGVKIIFTNITGSAVITEIEATIANGGKCIFLSGWMTNDRKQSVANGNIAIYGTPYASSTLDYLGISEPSYITDGQILDSSGAWYAGTMGTGEYCGVQLNIQEGEKATVTKIVLNFNDIITYDYTNPITGNRENKVKDDYVLGFDIQAKQNDGTFKTIASGTSYDTTSKSYVVSFDIDNVVTDDIRVVFTSNNAGFAFLKEIEIYASDVEYGGTQNGYNTFPHQRTKPIATKSFANPFVVYRSYFMDLISPISAS